MLFRKKEFLTWGQYNNLVSTIEHLCQSSVDFREKWGRRI